MTPTERNYVVTVRLSKSEKDKLEALAGKRGVSMSDEIRRLLRDEVGLNAERSKR